MCDLTYIGLYHCLVYLYDVVVFSADFDTEFTGNAGEASRCQLETSHQEVLLVLTEGALPRPRAVRGRH